MTDHLKEARWIYARGGTSDAVGHILSHLEQQAREKAGGNVPNINPITCPEKYYTQGNIQENPQTAFERGRAAGAKEERERIVEWLERRKHNCFTDEWRDCLSALISELR